MKISSNNTTFKIGKEATFTAVMAFVKRISSEKGKKAHKSFFNRFKAMTSNYEKWTLISENKFRNLDKMRLEFNAATTEIAVAV